MKKAVDPRRIVELKFDLLLKDLSGDVRLSLYNMAFMDKLLGAKLMYSKCKESAEEMGAVYGKEKTQPSTVVSRVGTPRAYAAIYLESFLYFVTSAFDILASITVHFYPTHKKTLKDGYFKNQIKTFLAAPNIDSDYAKLLSKNGNWIEDIENNRDGLAHKASAFLAFENDRVVFEKRRPYDDKNLLREKKFQDLIQYLDQTIKNLYVFLEDYVAIHRTRVPISDRSRNFLEALQKNLVWQT